MVELHTETGSGSFLKTNDVCSGVVYKCWEKAIKLH